MQKTYDELHQQFPSKKLVRKLLMPHSRPDSARILNMQECIQASLLVMLETSSLTERIYLTYRGKCLLHPYLDPQGEEQQITFDSKDREQYVTRKLARELQRVVRHGIEVRGQGHILVEDGDVVYVPKPIVPRYGNILFFIPRKTY